MKKITIIILMSMLLLGSVCFIEFNICKLSYNRNKNEADEVLKIAHNLVDSRDTSNELQNANNNTNKIENDVIGILYIEELDLEAPVKEGTTQEVMKTSIGHFTESDFWNGNVSLASHNSGTSMHYFQNIHKLKINDEIKYKTQLGEKVYKIKSIDTIKDTDWSMVEKNKNTDTKENTITLITCINGQPNYRLCVRGVEI